MLRDFRDCDFWTGQECNGVTGGEWAADLTVWAVGGATWVGLTYFFCKSRSKQRIYWAFLISPAWFAIAGHFAGAVLLGSSS